VRDNVNRNALSHAISRGISFAVLACDANVDDVVLDEEETVIERAGYDSYVPHDDWEIALEEYVDVLEYIDEFHYVLKETLSYHAVTDTRLSLGENGIYQEPLERVLEYMGLSMYYDQVVNTSFDEYDTYHALIPFQVLNATMWYHKAPGKEYTGYERHMQKQISLLRMRGLL
jgi:hypothetical protein